MYLPSAVILMREISAGVPMNAPDAPATIPKTHRERVTKCVPACVSMCVRACMRVCVCVRACLCVNGHLQ